MDESGAETGRGPRVLGEYSGFRTAWDTCAVLLVLVGSLAIPYQLVFVRSVGWSSSLLVYALDLFFLADIWLNRRTTYWELGREVTRPASIRARYARRLFAVDLIAALPVDLLLLSSDAVWWGTPAVLVFRLTRLLRIVRLVAVLRRWERAGWARSASLRIGRLLLVVAQLVHWVACGWYWLPVAAGFPTDSWVAVAGMMDGETASHYLRSLYWAVVTMTTVGYGDITPGRDAEYLYSMLVLGLGASMYAVIIANIASLVSNLDRRKVEFRARADGLERYMRSRRVPAATVGRVRRYYEYMWGRYRGINEHALLDDLPPSMRVDILRELTKDLVAHVPIFRESPSALRDALLTSLEPRSYVPGSLVVRDGDVADGIYFVSSGRLSVVGADGIPVGAELGEGEYFGDLSLMLEERRTASLVAMDYSDLLFLPRTDFERLKRDFVEFRGVLKSISAEKSEKMSSLVLEGIVL